MKAKMSKKSTLTITIMACLLAVAVATTIVLAAFSANKTASTVIKFSNGVQIRVNGAYAIDGAPTADVISKSATLVWGCSEGTTTYQKEANVENVSNPITMEAITFTNGNKNVSTKAWFVAKPSITCTSASPTAAQTTAAADALSAALASALDSAHSGANATWVAIGSTGWYAYGTTVDSGEDVNLDNTKIQFTDVAAGDDDSSLTTVAFLSAATISSSDINDLAGAQFTASIEVYAINADAANAQTDLAGKVTPTTPSSP